MQGHFWPRTKRAGSFGSAVKEIMSVDLIYEHEVLGSHI